MMAENVHFYSIGFPYDCKKVRICFKVQRRVERFKRVPVIDHLRLNGANCKKVEKAH